MKKKILALVLAVLTVAAVFAIYTIADKAPSMEAQLKKDLDAEDRADGILYTLDANTQTAVVGKAIYAEHNTSGYEGDGIVTIPDVVVKDGTEYVVREVGRNAFDGSAVKEVIILNTVTRIGEMAFADCANLERVAMGSGVTEIAGFAFWHCPKLVDASLGKNVKTIGGCAFWSCESLEVITIPQGATTIMAEAFKDCVNLKTVFVNSATTIAEDAFSGVGTYETTANYTPTIFVPTIYASQGENVTFRYLLEGNPGGVDLQTAFTVNGTPRSLTELGGVEVDEESAYNGTIFTFGEPVDGTKNFEVGYNEITKSGALIACDHAETEQVVVKAATCEVAGEAKLVCTKCHNEVGDKIVIDPLGHDYVEFEIEAVCLDGGYTTFKCSRCGDMYQDHFTDPTGHHYNDGTINSMPTYSKSGVKKFTCDTCKRVETANMPMIGDVNNDRDRNARDVIDVMKYALGKRDFDYDFFAETANCDGELDENTGAITITARDVIALMKACLWTPDSGKFLPTTPIPTAPTK